jgi:hypothetical protein
MQTKQDESLKDIQIKLYEMTKIKDNLKATNEFGPNFKGNFQNKRHFCHNQIGVLFFITEHF